MPFNSENPYQWPLALDKHMLCTFQISVKNQFMLPTPPSLAEHIPSISNTIESINIEDTIIVDSS